MADGTVADALAQLVAEQHEAIAADRAVGCGPDYRYDPIEVPATTVGGEPAAVYAFTGSVDGQEVERQRAYYTVHEDRLWVLVAPATHPDGCMASDLVEFTPADLATFEPFLDRIVRGSTLPAAP